jgi:hypothetical protein
MFSRPFFACVFAPFAWQASAQSQYASPSRTLLYSFIGYRNYE